MQRRRTLLLVVPLVSVSALSAGIAGAQIAPAPPPEPVAPPPPAPPADTQAPHSIELTTLRLLHEKNVLSDAEYQSALGDLADTAAGYVSEVEKLVDTEREHARALGELIGSGAYKLAADPEAAIGAPEAPGAVPTVDFGPLERSTARLRRSAKAYDDAFARAALGDFAIPSGDLMQLNSMLQGIEQELTSARGLPGREWYRHMLYAPGLYTGYAAKTLPGVREAVELHRWADASDYVAVAATCFEALAARIDQAAALLSARAKAPARGGAVTPPPPQDN